MSKLLHNLASDIPFGEKEKGMAQFNTFLASNRKKMKKVLHRLVAGDCTSIEHRYDDRASSVVACPKEELVDAVLVLREYLQNNNQTFVSRYFQRLQTLSNDKYYGEHVQVLLPPHKVGDVHIISPLAGT